MPPPAGPVHVRAYNVRFGDCVLISFDAGVGQKHVLVDFGNAPGSVKNKGGINDVFAPVAADLATRTKKVIDLLIVSHEHLDHMEGFYSQRKVFDGFTVHRTWMSAMSATDYYKRFPHCEVETRARLALLGLAERWERERRFERLAPSMRALIANNVLALANKERIDYLRGLAPKAKTKYLHRGQSLSTPELGAGVSFKVLAPEEDASTYYGSDGDHLWLDAAARLGAQARRRTRRQYRTPRAPEQMAADEFAQLRDEIGELDLADLLAIDKAANNPSLVIKMTVNGKTLLFPGDAEGESWAQMRSRNLLGPVDLLKLAHHGSINGMPFEGAASVIDKLLKPGRKTVALVSTCRNVYGETAETEIPHHKLMSVLEQRCAKVYVTQDAADFGEGVDITLP